MDLDLKMLFFYIQLVQVETGKFAFFCLFFSALKPLIGAQAQPHRPGPEIRRQGLGPGAQILGPDAWGLGLGPQMKPGAIWYPMGYHI